VEEKKLSEENCRKTLYGTGSCCVGPCVVAAFIPPPAEGVGRWDHTRSLKNLLNSLRVHKHKVLASGMFPFEKVDQLMPLKRSGGIKGVLSQRIPEACTSLIPSSSAW